MGILCDYNACFRDIRNSVLVQSRQLYFRLLRQFRPYLGAVLATLAAIGVAAATDVLLIRQLQNVVDALRPAESASGPLGGIQGATGGMMLTVQGWLDSLLPGNPTEAALWSIPLVITSLALLRMVSTFSGDYGSAWLTSRVQANLREAMFARIMRLPNGFFDQSSTGTCLLYTSDAADE